MKNYLLSGLAALVMGCATEVGSSTYCSKDTECKGERVCVKGICEEQSGYGGSSVSNKCGNSPLYGKYLWHTNCELGTNKSFDNNCNVFFIQDSGKEELMTYNGLTLKTQEGLTFDLVKDFSCENISDSKNLCSSYQCALSKNSSLYVLKSNSDGIKLNSNLWEIKNEPWPTKSNKSKCFSTIQQEECME